MRVHLTRAATFGPMCHFLEAGGVSVSRHLTGMGISPQLLSSPETLVPLQSCCRFVEGVASREGIDKLGIEVGSRTAIGDFGLFGMVLRQALTLKDLIEKLIQWMPLVDSGARAWLETVEQSDAVRLWIEHDTDVAKSLANEYGMVLLIDGVRMAAGPEWRPTDVWLDRSNANGISNFEALSEAVIHYHPHSAGFQIPRLLLSEPVRRESAVAEQRSNPEQSLESTAPPEDLIGSVICAIRSGMQSQAPSLDTVADMAGTNRRGMQRGLRSQGTSFRELLDRVRFEVATTFLGDERFHISEIAYHLGYTELSNFTHAFVRWTGLSPTAYREEFLFRK